MSNDETDVDDLFEQADDQSRTEVTTTAGDSSEETQLLADAIAEEYQQLQGGNTATTLTLRDERVAAIIRGLDETGRLDELSEAVWEEVPGEPDGQMGSRSGLLAGLVRSGLEDADGSLFDVDEEAYEQYQSEQETQTR